MDEKMMLEWIELVWEPATEGKRALLVLDSFSAHITNDVKKKLKDINTVPLIIPGGCTSKIQPLDVSLNKPFKSYVRQHWSNYVMTQSQSLTTSRKIQKPQKEAVSHWISDGLRQLQEKPDMVIRSFSACGIIDDPKNPARPLGLLEGQEYPDSEEDSDNPFLDFEDDDIIDDL